MCVVSGKPTLFAFLFIPQQQQLLLQSMLLLLFVSLLLQFPLLFQLLLPLCCQQFLLLLYTHMKMNNKVTTNSKWLTITAKSQVVVRLEREMVVLLPSGAPAAGLHVVS